MYKIPNELFKFIGYLKVDPSGDVVINGLDRNPSFVSRYYTPSMRVSGLSTRFIWKLQGGRYIESADVFNPDSLVGRVMNSHMKTDYPYEYNLMQTVCLESTALIYATDEDPQLFMHLLEADLTKVRENIKYLIDVFSADEKYAPITENLNAMHVAIGYTEKQVPMIQKELRASGSL